MVFRLVPTRQEMLGCLAETAGRGKKVS